MRLPSRADWPVNLHVGSRLPAYCTSLGKVLLAHLPRDARTDALARVELVRRGPNTLVSRRALADELARVRTNGFAVNNEELAYGLRSIAAPVVGHDGEAVAAINLAVHRTMVSMEDLFADLSPRLRSTAEEISAQLGYRA